MANSALKVSKVPAAFSPIGAKHNALVDLVKGIQGGSGITVKASDAKIIISSSVTGSGGGGGTEGAPINVVGGDGKLNLVPKHSTWATPTTYPTTLAVVNGSVTASMSSSGINYRHPDITITINNGGFYAYGLGGSVTANDYGFSWYDGTYTADIDGNGIKFFTSSGVTAVLKQDRLTFDSPTVDSIYHRDYLQIDSGNESGFVSATGFSYIDQGSTTAYFGTNGIYWSYGGATITADDNRIAFIKSSSTGFLNQHALVFNSSTVATTYHRDFLQFDDGSDEAFASATGFIYKEPGVVTAALGYDGFLYQYGGVSLTADDSGFRIRNASATASVEPTKISISSSTSYAELSPGNLTLSSGTDSVTYGVSALRFTSGSDRTQTSATGFNYDYLNGTIQGDFGEDGLYWSYAGTVISADDNAFVFQVGSTTANLDESRIVFQSSTVSGTYHRDFLTIKSGNDRIYGSATGYIYDNSSSVTASLGSDGIFFRNSSLTHSIGTTGIVADFGSNEVRIESTTFLITGASASISIAYASISVQISLTAIDVCSNGTPKKMLILGSAPY